MNHLKCLTAGRVSLNSRLSLVATSQKKSRSIFVLRYSLQRRTWISRTSFYYLWRMRSTMPSPILFRLVRLLLNTYTYWLYLTMARLIRNRSRFTIDSPLMSLSSEKVCATRGKLMYLMKRVRSSSSLCLVQKRCRNSLRGLFLRMISEYSLEMMWKGSSCLNWLLMMLMAWLISSLVGLRMSSGASKFSLIFSFPMSSSNRFSSQTRSITLISLLFFMTTFSSSLPQSMMLRSISLRYSWSSWSISKSTSSSSSLREVLSSWISWSRSLAIRDLSSLILSGIPGQSLILGLLFLKKSSAQSFLGLLFLLCGQLYLRLLLPSSQSTHSSSYSYSMKSLLNERMDHAVQ